MKVGQPVKKVMVCRLYTCILKLKTTKNTTLQEMTDRIHEELKKLDTPYAELESFTGLKTISGHTAFAEFFPSL